jgi:branched-subunit amino acid aminotransferase/4-amino-4-deoxychorismate lyase
MIWVDGRVVADDALKVSVLDRTFEHGLGLFETFRTWNRRAPLLGRHLERLTRSAHELRLPIESVTQPNADAVADLLDAEKVEGDVVLRITLSGGLTEIGGATLWMRALPLPPPMRHEGAIVDVGSWWSQLSDPLSRYKALNYWSRRLAYDQARELGFDEVLNVESPPGSYFVWEGSRTNVFAVRHSTLRTPSSDGPIVPGIMRALVLELARELPIEVVKDSTLELPQLAGSDEVFLTNSVRGIVPVASLNIPINPTTQPSWPVPGPWTQRLSMLVADWLGSGSGGTPT